MDADELAKRAHEFSRAFGIPVDVGDVFDCERCGRFLPLEDLQLNQRENSVCIDADDCFEVRYINQRKREESLYREQAERGTSAKPVRRWLRDA